MFAVYLLVFRRVYIRNLEKIANVANCKFIRLILKNPVIGLHTGDS